MQKIVGIVLLVLAFGVLVFMSVFCWALRDGMGLDSTTSSGSQAVGRFLPLFVIAAVVLSPVWGAALVLIRAGSEKPRQARKPSTPAAGVWPPPPPGPAI